MKWNFPFYSCLQCFNVLCCVEGNKCLIIFLLLISRTVWWRVWSYLTRSATTSGLQIRLLSSSSTRKICLQRKSPSHLWLSASLNTQVNVSNKKQTFSGQEQQSSTVLVYRHNLSSSEINQSINQVYFFSHVA